MAFELPQIVRLQTGFLTALEQAENHEWWITNGIGGYGGGTVAGTLTRRYHGLLISPLHGLLDRHLLFAKADVELIEGSKIIPLHTNRWRSGAVTPQGHLALSSFHLDGLIPVWRYTLDDVELEARLWMMPGQRSTYLAWNLLRNPSERNLRLRARLLINIRDHHGNGNDGFGDPHVEADRNNLHITHTNAFQLHFHSRCGETEAANFCVCDFDLPQERERGLPDHDHHLCVGHITFPLHEDQWVGMVATLEANASPYVMEAMRSHQQHSVSLLSQTKNVVPEFTSAPPWIDQLVLAASHFVIRLKSGDSQRPAIIAGYPWFGEWGRDSMIALPGLLIATGRYRIAEELLTGYLPLLNRGMLPNYFPGDGEVAQYNTVDAALWYIEAWCTYLRNTPHRHAIETAWPALQDIIRHYSAGTRHGIVRDAQDGLLRAGEDGVQLTWMDAKVGDRVITPRIGKAVEINALWYNALRAMVLFAQLMKHPVAAAHYEALAEQARIGFQRFIKPDGEGLYDVLDGPTGNDASLRPNQIFAVSLPYSPLDPQTQQRVVETCRRHLLTPYGLRTLNREHPDYRGHYTGGVWERDSAYHQGTVWPWLLGHYALAEHRVSGDAAAALQRLEVFSQHLNEAGLGTISEIFDAEPPHRARGCPAQAWSIACVLEAWWKLNNAARAAKQTEQTT